MNTSYKKSNFGPAFFFLNEEQKEALADIYAFCRTVDDIADEPSSNPKGELAGWREEIDKIFSDQKPFSELAKALQRHAVKFNLSKENFTLLIDGMEMDLDRTEYKTFEDLEKYMYRVAVVVGLMCCEVMGLRKEEILDYATNLGYAVQLTNIIRDVYSDIELGRVYLPEEDMQKYGILSIDLQTKNTAALAPILSYEGEKAKEFFNKAKALFPKQYKKQLLAAKAMGALYEAILNKIANRKYVFTEKVSLSKIEKTFVIIKELVK
ncbi:phytoene synthase [Elusimicrobium simillimum]|uniref:phytoene/squalene synthase family protein n=1 Tax=Elusimicrobium simillimum TaxID=3143438 RepID=UPI003C6EC674